MEKKKENLTEGRITSLLHKGRYDELGRELVSRSNLPGPAANLTLMYAFADLCAERADDEGLLTTLYRWASLDTTEAPFGGPKEFLPACALVSLGTLYPVMNAQAGKIIIDLVKKGARDVRWRCREGAAMAFQRIGEQDFNLLMGIFTVWLRSADLMEQRCIMASLAHPPLLTDTERISFCLNTAGTILEGIRTMTPEVRKSDGYRVVKKGLDYCISVFVAHGPDEGFHFLEEWLRCDNDVITRIVNTNMRKARLLKKHGDRVKKLLEKYPLRQSP